jgi:hypothetical protein
VGEKMLGLISGLMLNRNTNKERRKSSFLKGTTTAKKAKESASTMHYLGI